MPNAITLSGLDGYEIISLIFSTAGVGIYNWFDEEENLVTAKTGTSQSVSHYHNKNNDNDNDRNFGGF